MSICTKRQGNLFSCKEIFSSKWWRDSTVHQETLWALNVHWGDLVPPLPCGRPALPRTRAWPGRLLELHCTPSALTVRVSRIIIQCVLACRCVCTCVQVCVCRQKGRKWPAKISLVLNVSSLLLFREHGEQEKENVGCNYHKPWFIHWVKCAYFIVSITLTTVQ